MQTAIVSLISKQVHDAVLEVVGMAQRRVEQEDVAGPRGMRMFLASQVAAYRDNAVGPRHGGVV